MFPNCFYASSKVIGSHLVGGFYHDGTLKAKTANFNIRAQSAPVTP